MPLTPPDAALVARDRALPGLALLLDPDRLAAVLAAALPDAAITGLTTTYLRYKPETSCLAGVELETSAGVIRLAAKAFKPRRYAVERGRPPPPGLASPLGPVVLPLDAHAVLCRLVPYDRELRALPRLVDAGQRQALLRRLVPTLAAADWRVLRHKPGRRHIGQLVEGPTGRAIVKLYTPDHYGQARRGARFGTGVGGAGLLAHSDRHGILVSAWQPGVPLATLPPLDPAALAAMAAAGATLAAVHRQRPAILPPRTVAGEIDAVRRAAASLGRAAPALAERASGLARTVAGRLEAAGPSDGAVHGDFSADQVVVGELGVRLIDWDRAGVGPRALDLGSFIARLEMDALLAGQGPPQAAIGSFADGHAAAARRPPEALEAWVAAGLLRLVNEPFRRRLPDWPAAAAMLLARVEQLVAKRSGRRCRRLEALA